MIGPGSDKKSERPVDALAVKLDQGALGMSDPCFLFTIIPLYFIFHPNTAIAALSTQPIVL